jgi:DNA-binding phage protein
MSNKSIRSANRPQSIAQQAAADFINRALEKSDIAEICHAIAAATRLYNISDLRRNLGFRGRAFIVRLQVTEKAKLHDCS